jgi:Domain of unknown function (DUF4936)
VNPAELYVYYRLAPEQVRAARAAFEAACAGASVRLLQRQEPEQGLLTWMEIYEPELAATLEPRVATAMAAFVQGARHYERFAALHPTSQEARGFTRA